MFHIAAFYKFVELPDHHAVHTTVLELCTTSEVLGTVLVASEGINGTIAGTEDGIETVIAGLRSVAPLSDLVVKHSTAQNAPFLKLKVRMKKEIVSLGVGPVNAAGNTGTKVSPSEWNTLIADPDVLLIDTRNDYETEIGSFTGAVNPETRSFTEFPTWIDDHGDLLSKPKIAMFCTGGIRCEKASAYLREQGFEEVYQLDGGILRYLETVPEAESAWDGECYVFDRRVSVGHGLAPGDNTVCVNCDRVVTKVETELDGYVEGVCCSRCHDTISDERRARFTERQHQIELAAQRGTAHLGRTAVAETT